MKKWIIGAFCMMMVLAAAGCAQETPAQDNEPGDEPPVAQENVESGNTTIDTILQAYSSKEFTAGDIPEDTLELILTSGAKAPSARNFQPWHFTVVKGNMATELVPIAQEGNVVIVVSGLNTEEPGINVDFDCALAVQNINLAARSLGYGTHIYTGGVDQINADKKEDLAIPEGYDAVAMILIGTIPEDADALSSASTRNPLEEQMNVVE